MMLVSLILFWKAQRLSHLFFTGQVFNVNLSRKTIIITLTTLQLLGEKAHMFITVSALQ